MEYINFRKTRDKNIVLADNISRNEQIFIDKLEKQIVDIQKQIDNIPDLIPNTGVENEDVLELIKDYNMNIPSNVNLEKEKKVKTDLLNQCLAAKEK